jgi:hypothetical protein
VVKKKNVEVPKPICSRNIDLFDVFQSSIPAKIKIKSTKILNRRAVI